jgi:hypothetical protein
MITSRGPAGGDDGFLGAAAAGDAPVPLAQEGIGAAGGGGGVAEDPGQVAVAVTGGALAFLLPGGFLDAGGELGPVNASCSAVILPRITPPGQLRQRLRIALPADQRGQHLPARDAEDVRDHHAELDARVLQQFLGPLLFRGARRHQAGAVAGDIAQPPELGRRHETRPDHLPPGRVLLDEFDHQPRSGSSATRRSP